jgi:hypothetical protein
MCSIFSVSLADHAARSPAPVSQAHDRGLLFWTVGVCRADLNGRRSRIPLHLELKQSGARAFGRTDDFLWPLSAAAIDGGQLTFVLKLPGGPEASFKGTVTGNAAAGQLTSTIPALHGALSMKRVGPPLRLPSSLVPRPSDSKIRRLVGRLPWSLRVQRSHWNLRRNRATECHRQEPHGVREYLDHERASPMIRTSYVLLLRCAATTVCLRAQNISGSIPAMAASTISRSCTPAASGSCAPATVAAHIPVYIDCQ